MIGSEASTSTISWREGEGVLSDGEGEVGFGALSRLVAVHLAGAEEGVLVLRGLRGTAEGEEVLVRSERGFLRGSTRLSLLASILTSSAFGFGFPFYCGLRK